MTNRRGLLIGEDRCQRRGRLPTEEGFRTPTTTLSFNNGQVLQQWSRPSTTVMSFNNGHVLQQRSRPSTTVLSYQQPSPICHPDRSEAEGRDLRCAIRVPHIYPSTTTFAISKPKDPRVRGPSLEMFSTKHSVVDRLGKT